MLYAAKCYWPGVTRSELEQAAARATEVLRKPGARDVTYRGSLLFVDDDLVLCLFNGPSPTAVKRASERAGIPCERVMHSVWLQPDRRTPTGARQ
jgi:Nickel responsive protein SCO4226-like